MSSLHLVTGYAGKEHVTSADQGSFHAALLLKGSVVLNVGNKFAATVVSNNSIKIQDGDILMQGRYIKLDSGTFVEVPIENGTQDYKRNDLIVVRYTKNATTGVESTALAVIKGTPDITEAVDPEYTQADILDGALTCDMPLYRVPIDGLNVGELVPLFEEVDSFDERLGQKSDKGHKHTKSEITDFPTSMTPTAHKHTKSDISDFPTSLPASDVYEWAKAAKKPEYTASEVGASATGHTHTKSDITDLGDALSGNMKYTDKPSGTYTGNGSDTERIIDTGGVGNMLLIYETGSTFFVIATPNGAIMSSGSSWSCYKATKVCYENGILTLASSATGVNVSGTTYNYQCI